MTDDTNSKSTRQWGGFAIGVGFFLIGVVPGVFSGWQATSYIFAIGGLVIAVGNLVWISRSRRRRDNGRDDEKDS